MIALVAAMAASPTFWFVHPPGGPSAMDGLCISGPPATEAAYTMVRGLARRPAAIAWAGTSVWLLPDADAPRPSLLALRAEWDAGLESWASIPADGFSRLPAVPEEGRVDRLLASQDGPSIVLHEGGGVYSLRTGQWRDRGPLPIEPSERVLLAAGQGETVVLCVGAERPKALLRSSGLDTDWTRQPCDVPEGEAVDLLMHNGTPLIGLHAPDDRRVLGYLQGGGFALWQEVPSVPAGAKLVTTEGGLALLDVSPEAVRLKHVGGRTNAPWVQLTRSSRMDSGVWSLLVIVGIGVVVLLIIVMGRRAEVVPAGARPAPLARRMIAVGLDLVPGMVACVVAFGAGSMDVIAALVTGPLPATIPMLATLAVVTAAWGFGWEYSRGWTPGKRLLRLRVVTAVGGDLRWWQVLLRNILKGVVVLAPPLAILVVLTPLSQSPGDIVARTLVIDAPPSDDVPSKG